MSQAFNCEYCTYTTNRSYDLKRHQTAKHKQEIENEQSLPNAQKVLYCKKCYKQYRNRRSLQTHENLCNGVDTLTCKRCMTTFASYQSKYNHVKRNNCKPRNSNFYENPNLAKLQEMNIPFQSNITNNTTNNNITPTEKKNETKLCKIIKSSFSPISVNDNI